MKFLNKEHYAWMKLSRTTVGDYQTGYDVDTIDYVAFNTLDEVVAHYKTRDKYNTGVYFRMTPLKFETTVKVSE